MKVWVITDGYDSPTLGVFSRREDAEAVRGLCDNPSFEELELDEMVGAVVGPIFTSVGGADTEDSSRNEFIRDHGAHNGIRPEGFANVEVSPHWSGTYAYFWGSSANSQEEAREMVRVARDQWLTEKAGGWGVKQPMDYVLAIAGSIADGDMSQESAKAKCHALLWVAATITSAHGLLVERDDPEMVGVVDSLVEGALEGMRAAGDRWITSLTERN